MTSYANGNWHNANGGGLPYRPPPTVDEVLPYSPFTSIIPFSPDIIPFPSAEPPTPNSTLTNDQRTAAKKAVDILNHEIQGQRTAQHLNDTLRQLRDLLNRDNLPEYNFKPMPQLVTPPPDSPAKDKNGAASSYEPKLSPFASLLLKSTNVPFTPLDSGSHDQPARFGHSPKVVIPSSQTQTATPTPAATPNRPAQAQTPRPHPSSVKPSAPSNAPVRPGPAIVAQPLKGRREEYKYHDKIDAAPSLSQQKKDKDDSSASALRPHEREIADRKTGELNAYVELLLEEKDDPEDSNKFMTTSTPHGDIVVMQPRSIDALFEKMSNIINLGRFAALPVGLVVSIQTLLQPTISSATTGDFFLTQESDAADWQESLQASRIALKAAKMTLDTMIEGRDDYRMRREDVIDVMVDLIKYIKDACILPILKVRRTEELFSAAVGQRQQFQAILHSCGSVLGRFATLIGRCNLSDRALNTLEFLTLELLMEQNSESEKDSIFTIQKFEQFRQKTVDVVAQIFARHAQQRNSILNGIISNLEKLPDKKASARHFRSAWDPPIMIISALFMRFVHAAATNREAPKSENIDDDERAEEDGGSNHEPGVADKRTSRKTEPSQIALNLMQDANGMAGYIAKHLIDKASNVSKTSDKNFRNLLDFFIEDFCNVLGSPEWPAADMLLRQLLGRMRNMIVGDQAANHSVVSKDMALATMARIGCGVIDFKHKMKKLKREHLDASQSELSSKLDKLVDEALVDDGRQGINNADLLAFEGPYRMVIESLRHYLGLGSDRESPHFESISSCHVTLWLSAVIQAFPERDSDSQPLVIKDVQGRLESMIMDTKWLAQKFKFQHVSPEQSRLASGVITLQNQVCRFLPQILNVMLSSTRDKASSKLRSRAMSSLQQLIDKDPRGLTEAHIRGMADLLSDSSPMVRESTLSMVATYLELDKSHVRHVLTKILSLTTDPSNGPKKRAIKLLKDIYMSGTSQDNKRQISASLLKPSQDDEKPVAELARGVLEEMWLTIGKPSSKNDDSHIKLARAQRSTLLTEVVQMIQDSTEYLEAFEKFFVWALSDEGKSPRANLQTCKDLVADLIDEVISPEAGSASTSQPRIMTTLSIFAKVRASLFTIDQVQLLKLYIKEISNTEDLALLRPTVTIFRYVFATVGSLQQSFAEEICNALMKNISKLSQWASNAVPTSRNTLVDVAHCLWTITPMVDNGPPKLCSIIASVLCQVRPLASCSKEEAARNRNKITSYLIILGTFGKVCNFDQHIDVFRDRLASTAKVLIAKNLVPAEQLKPLLSKDTSASLLLLDTVRLFTMQSWEMSVRVQALHSVGGICQQSPQLFMRAEIEKIFKLVFVNVDNEHLRRVALGELNEYFTFAERRSESGAAIAVGQGATTGNARLETSFVANDNDSATLHIAQRFLPKFVEVALNSTEDLALICTSIIASISRQGLVHPKECGAALVALSTSPNDRIATIASTEHRRIHEKQESYLEKEYMQAIHMALEYQCTVYNDPHGMREATYSPKLASLFDALKAGNKATLRKFINNICKQIDFDFQKLDTSENPPAAVSFTRFALENIALLDFDYQGTLALCLACMEALVLRNTGSAVAMAIETEMPQQFIARNQAAVQDPFQQHLGDAGGDISFSTFMNQAPTTELVQPTIDDARLRQLATACVILQMVWETRIFIRRCYNLQKSKEAIPQKDYSVKATRNNLVAGKEIFERLNSIMTALDSRELMIKICYEFMELLDIDKDHAIPDDVDAAIDLAGYDTPDEDKNPDGPSVPTSGRGRKRKSNINLGNTPKKARGRPSGAKGKKRNSRTPDGDDDSD